MTTWRRWRDAYAAELRDYDPAERGPLGTPRVPPPRIRHADLDRRMTRAQRRRADAWKASMLHHDRVGSTPNP